MLRKLVAIPHIDFVFGEKRCKQYLHDKNNAALICKLMNEHNGVRDPQPVITITAQTTPLQIAESSEALMDAIGSQAACDEDKE